MNRLEVLYHFIMAEEHEKAAIYAFEKKAILFRTGYLDEVLDLVRKEAMLRGTAVASVIGKWNLISFRPESEAVKTLAP